MKKNIAVFCVLLYEDEILLGKRNYGNYGWTLPGGSVEENEGIIKAIKREAKEETNQEIEDVEYVLTSYSVEDYSVALIFLSKIKEKREILYSMEELTEVKWFNIKELPEKLTKRQLIWIENCLKKKLKKEYKSFIEL